MSTLKLLSPGMFSSRLKIGERLSLVRNPLRWMSGVDLGVNLESPFTQADPSSDPGKKWRCHPPPCHSIAISLPIPHYYSIQKPHPTFKLYTPSNANKSSKHKRLYEKMASKGSTHFNSETTNWEGDWNLIIANISPKKLLICTNAHRK
jgi:hypothetical protein